MNFSDLQNFLIAIAIGGLIGLEREIGTQAREKYTFAGFRTFILISFFGALSYFLGENFNIPYISTVAFIIFSILVIVTYYVSAKKGFIGITSELSSILTFLLGILVMQSQYQIYAIVFSVMIAILLAFKKYVRQIVQKTRIEEWYDTLKFAFIAFVILPLLPNQGFGPYEFFNPYKTWLTVVLVSGLSFVGYFAIKFFGSKLGIGLSGFLGGLASSTAVTTSMAHRSKEASNKNYRPFVIATVLACVVMFIRVLIESYAIFSDLSLKLIIPFSLMFIVGLIPMAILWKKDSGKDSSNIDLQSPFSLKPALTFAAIFLAIQLIVKFIINNNYGGASVLIASIIAGITDVDAITLSLSDFAKSGGIDINNARDAVMAAVFTNTLVKGGIAWFWGGMKYRKNVILILSLILIVGIISIIVF